MATATEQAQASAYSVFLEIGLQKVHKRNAATYPILWKGLINQTKVKEFIRDDNLITGFQQMPEKTIGGVFSLDKPEFSSTKEGQIKTYGLAYVAEYELARWDQYRVFDAMSSKLSYSGLYTKNLLGFSIFNNAFSTSAGSEYLIHNGEALCDVNHVLTRSSTTAVGKNHPTTASDLNYLSIQEAITDFKDTVDEDGLFVMLNPKVLLTSTTFAWIADEIVGSRYRQDNANNAKNTLGHLRAETSPFLTDGDAWFVLSDVSGPWGDSVEYEIGDDLRPRKSFQHSTLNTILSMYMSCRLWVFNWIGSWGSPGK